jgi:hypothetical protein
MLNMGARMKDEKHEQLVAMLGDTEALCSFKNPCDNMPVGPAPKLLGWLLVAAGDFVYGEEPSYGKFRAVEVVARIPYESWEAASYTLLTMFYTNEARAIEFLKTVQFARIAHDNETMHVIVLSQLAKKYDEVGFFRYTFLPLLFALFYYWAAYFLYLFSPRSAYELNYLFEDHAYAQYHRFLELNEVILRETPVVSAFLEFYGRSVSNEYELFLSIRNDELTHRNQSIQRAQSCK